MTYDYAVIGAGVAGMSAALILAKNGARVALVEKSPQLAPLLRGFSRNGVYFDTGFHCSGGLGDGEPLQVFLRYLGMADKLQLVPYRSDGFDCFRWQSPPEQFAFPYGWERIEDALIAAFPAERAAIGQYLRVIRAYYQSLPYINLDVDFSPMQVFPDGLGLSLKESLDRLTNNERLKSVLSGHWFLHGVVPEDVPLHFHAQVVASYYGSVHGVLGGGRSLVDAFSGQLQQHGVDVHCDNGVSTVEFSATGEVTGVRLESGEGLTARACVSTVHPQRLVDMVPESLFRAAYRARLKTYAETESAFILYANYSTVPEELRNRNLVVMPEGAEDFADAPVAPEKKLLFLAGTPIRTDDVSTPGGFSAICPMSHLQTQRWADSVSGRRPRDYIAFKQRISESILQRMAAVCPEVAEKVTGVEVATPLTLRDYAHLPTGSLYGIKRTVGGHTLGPRTRATGLFLAGQSIVAPGLLGAMLSSFLAGGMILGHERLQKELQAWR